MQVMYATGGDKRPRLRNTAAAIGIFDGVHKGHQLLIRRMVQTARRKKLNSLVITFYPHPAEVLHKRQIQYLISLKHRLQLLEELGVENVLVIRFTKRFAHLKPEQFVKQYLVEELGVKEVFVGDDFRFGENRSGDVDIFTRMGRQYGFKVNHINPLRQTKDKISSSELREFICQGRLKEAKIMLGRPVSVMGEVVRGDGRGRTLNFPTANIRIESDVLPPNGVYLVRAHLNNQSYPALCNIGVRPSFKSARPLKHVEVYILNFNKSIYGCSVVVEFLKKIRDEQKFPTVQALIAQIQKDQKVAQRFFARL